LNLWADVAKVWSVYAWKILNILRLLAILISFLATKEKVGALDSTCVLGR
jgi:hypothetical protein